MGSSPSHSPAPLLAPISRHSPPSPQLTHPEQPAHPQHPALPYRGVRDRRARGLDSAPPLSGTTHRDSAPPPSEVTQLDAELHRLARGAGRLRLRIGQALHRLADGIHELGFSTLGAYALERCNRGGRWAAETRTLARRLQSLPLLTMALESGAIGWSMAELLARHANPQTEAALLTIARGQTVQSMRLAFAQERAPNSKDESHVGRAPHTECDDAQAVRRAPHTKCDDAQGDDQDDDLARTLSLTLPVEEAWAFEATRMMVEHMDGKPTGAHFLESLLAEATVPLLDLAGPPQADPNEADVSAQMEAEHAAWRAQMERLQHQQAQAELQSRPAVSADPNPGDAPDASDLPTGIRALDARIRHYSAELASRDLFFGRIAQRFLAIRGWQTLGFSTEAHYARDRLGMSRASLRSKVALAHRTGGLDHVVDALQQGRIGFEAAQLIARVASPTTERAWLTRAERRTFKHLREEVQAVEMATRFLGTSDHSPPSEEHIQQMQSLERAILSGELLRRVISNGAAESREDESDAVQISVSPDSDEGIGTDEGDEHLSQRAGDQSNAVQISVTPNSKVTLRIRVPGDVLLHYRQLERLHRQKRPGESFVEFLCTVFWQTWVPHLGTSDKWEQIYRRDRYRCTNPVCHNRNVTLHHVKYRANGGTDAPENLTSPCAFCHLEGEHGGRLKILPPGNDPTWILGRHPIMRVQNRERTLLS